MAQHSHKTKKNAQVFAADMRRKGFNASIHKKKKGWGSSITRR